jgi:cobalt/nickel transport system permease protein
MQPIHLAIGIVEGIVTAAILTFIYAARPQLLESTASDDSSDNSKPKSLTKGIIVFACIAIVAGTFLSIFASKNPDGLEWAIIGTAGENVFLGMQGHFAPLPDYESGLGSGSGISAAGIIGAVLVFALAGAAALIISIVKKNRKNAVK